MSYSSQTDDTAPARALYGEPQHDDGHTTDLEIFGETDRETDERVAYVHGPHFHADERDVAAEAQTGDRATVA